MIWPPSSKESATLCPTTDSVAPVMIKAFVRRKASFTEDVLTSVVFGLLEHHHGALISFLERARTLDGRVPLRGIEGQLGSPEFWPRTAEFGEPDVIIRGRLDHSPMTVIVEAKLGAGKSQWALPVDRSEGDVPSDQLARYWAAWKSETFGPLGVGERCVIVYLTGHMSPPVEDLEESTAAAPDATMTWLSWGDLVPVLDNVSETGVFRAVAEDLLAILRSWGFGPFSGFSSLKGSEQVDIGTWSFDAGGFAECATPTVEENGPRWIFESSGNGGSN